MASHSSTLAWKIPWTEEPGGLPSMGSHRIGHNWSDLAVAAAAAAASPCGSHCFLSSTKDVAMGWEDFLLIEVRVKSFFFFFFSIKLGKHYYMVPLLQKPVIILAHSVGRCEEGNDNPLQYLAWEIPWAEEPSRLQIMGLQESDMTWQQNHRHMYRLHTAPS